jgi:glutamate racemase
MSVLTTHSLLLNIGIPLDDYFDMVSAVKLIPFSLKDKVLILGTKATINSGVYQGVLKEKNISYEVFSPSSLAGNIEIGDIPSVVSNIEEIIVFAKKTETTHILYACTHYPLVSDFFISVAEKNKWFGKYIDPATYLAKEIEGLFLCGESLSFFETSLHTKVFDEYVEKYKK